MTEETKFCHNCGAEIDAKALTCPECGVLQQDKSMSGRGEKNSGLAAILSFFFTVLGQMYNGQIAKGILLIIVQITNLFLMLVAVGFITYPIVRIYGIWDAYTTSEKINAGE